MRAKASVHRSQIGGIVSVTPARRNGTDVRTCLPRRSAATTGAEAGLPRRSTEVPGAKAGLPRRSTEVPGAKAGLPRRSAATTGAEAGLLRRSTEVPGAKAGRVADSWSATIVRGFRARVHSSAGASNETRELTNRLPRRGRADPIANRLRANLQNRRRRRVLRNR
jgi:hypothetical protein